MTSRINSTPIPAWYRLASAAGFICAGIAIAVGLMLLLSTTATILDWGDVFIGASLYVLSQGIRAVRLAIIVGDPGKSLRQLVQAHLIGTAASFCLPYKIGDLLRIVELAFVLRRKGNLGVWRSILVVWIERVYDALPIAVLLLFLAATAGEDTLLVVAPILAALVTFIVLTLLTFFVLPENLDGLTLFLARRYHGSQVVTLLRYVDRLYRLAADAKRMLHRKHITLMTCSALIWGAEIAVIGLIFRQGTVGGPVAVLLRFLSGLLSPGFAHQPGNLSAYSAAIGIPLLLLGAVAWCGALLTGRLRIIALPRLLDRLETQRTP